MTRNILTTCIRIAQSRGGNTHPSWYSHSLHYSFIVQNNAILSLGLNRPNTTNPKHYGYPSYAGLHAEIDAYKKARGILEEDQFELINIRLLRIKKDEFYQIGMAAPCRPCLDFILSQSCTNIYFTTENGLFAKLVV